MIDYGEYRIEKNEHTGRFELVDNLNGITTEFDTISQVLFQIKVDLEEVERELKDD